MSGHADPESKDDVLLASAGHKGLIVGETIQATVTGFTEYAAILTLATGYTAYLNVHDISWLSQHLPPDEMLRVGETVSVQITAVKKREGKKPIISVNRRVLLTDPWKDAATLHSVGSRFNARIIKFSQIGALVQLETGFVGLLHNNELSWTTAFDDRKKEKSKGERVKSYFAINDCIPVIIQSVDATRKKLSLSYRQTLPNPWQSIESDYPIGTRLIGYVDHVVKFGIFVRLPNRCHGLIHSSELGSGFAEEYEYGERVEVRVLSVDRLNQRVALTLDQQASQEEWRNIISADVFGETQPLDLQTSEHLMVEGRQKIVSVNYYERNPAARRVCLSHHGYVCAVCKVDLRDVYGPIADGVIHVHHLRPISEIGGEYTLEPVGDLRPVCPNCHAVLHRRKPPYSIEEARGFLLKAAARTR